MSIKLDKNITRTTRLTPEKRKDDKVAPQLRISGSYLEENGFKIDEIVEILIREDLLIIQPVKNE